MGRIISLAFFLKGCDNFETLKQKYTFKPFISLQEKINANSNTHTTARILKNRCFFTQSRFFARWYRSGWYTRSCMRLVEKTSGKWWWGMWLPSSLSGCLYMCPSCVIWVGFWKTLCLCFLNCVYACLRAFVRTCIRACENVRECACEREGNVTCVCSNVNLLLWSVVILILFFFIIFSDFLPLPWIFGK